MTDYSQNLRAFVIACPGSDKITRKLLSKMNEAARHIDELQAENDKWKKQKCGPGFNIDGAGCDHRHADIGHYISHYKRAKEIIKELQAENDKLKEELIETHREGYEEGIRAYAWWKDGVQYVGSCGTTLKEALKGKPNG